jgi:pyrroline-5-carboxylate reductase
MSSQVSIIGLGNLTTSMLTGIDKIKHNYKINVIDIDKKKQSIAKKFNVSFYSSFTDILCKSDLIILMVKPNNYKDVIRAINPFLSNKNIILSFMAGITIAEMKKEININVPIIRCMTNITISTDISYIFYFIKSFNKKSDTKLSKFFNKFSILKKCKTEEDINKITALYGSGPAYYVYFNQIIRDSFIKMGFKKKDAIDYTNDLISGSANIIKENKISDNLINKIASKGGTTQAALSELNNNKLNSIISKSIVKAYKKSKNILKK